MSIWSQYWLWNPDSGTASSLLICTGEYIQVHLSVPSVLRRFTLKPVTLGKEDIWPAYPLTPFDGMEVGGAVHFCDVSHLQDISKDGGRALPHLTDLQNLRKNPIFLRDLIPSDCAPALDKITLRGSGGSGPQPTFGGQHHLCLISFGVGFIFNFTRGGGQLWKHIDNLDPVLQEAIHNSKWFAHAMQLSMPIDQWALTIDQGQKIFIHR